MPSVDRFARFASGTGIVPRVPPPIGSEGYKAAHNNTKTNQLLSPIVPRVPHVPLLNDTGTDEIDWLAFFDERAGIREFDGGLRRAEAERLAAEDTVAALGPRPGVT